MVVSHCSTFCTTPLSCKGGWESGWVSGIFTFYKKALPLSKSQRVEQSPKQEGHWDARQPQVVNVRLRSGRLGNAVITKKILNLSGFKH